MQYLFWLKLPQIAGKSEKSAPSSIIPALERSGSRKAKDEKKTELDRKKQTPRKTCVKNLAIIFLVFVSQKGRFFSQGGTLKITIFSAKKGGKKMLFLKPVKKQNHFVSVLIFLA